MDACRHVKTLSTLATFYDKEADNGRFPACPSFGPQNHERKESKESGAKVLIPDTGSWVRIYLVPGLSLSDEDEGIGRDDGKAEIDQDDRPFGADIPAGREQGSRRRGKLVKLRLSIGKEVWCSG